MKKNIKFLFLLLILFIGSKNVSASEFIQKNNNNIKLINNNGISITENIYEKLKVYDYSDEEILNLNQETYNYFKNLQIDSYSKSDSYYEDIYIYKTKEQYENGLAPSNVITKEITKEKFYSNSNLNNTRALNNDAAIYEISSRKLTMIIGYWTDTPTTKNVSIQTTFKTIPSVRSYDIMAMRITNGEFVANTQRVDTVMTYQVPTAACDGIYTTQSSTASASHTSAGFNTKSAGLGYYGVGFTGLLPNDFINCYNDLSFPFYQTLTGYKITMYVTARALGGNSITLNGTYQHATSSVSFSNVARTYDFNSTGLGNVIKFNNGMASYYDRAGGASLTY